MNGHPRTYEECQLIAVTPTAEQLIFLTIRARAEKTIALLEAGKFSGFLTEEGLQTLNSNINDIRKDLLYYRMPNISPEERMKEEIQRAKDISEFFRGTEGFGRG